MPLPVRRGPSRGGSPQSSPEASRVAPSSPGSTSLVPKTSPLSVVYFIPAIAVLIFISCGAVWHHGAQRSPKGLSRHGGSSYYPTLVMNAAWIGRSMQASLISEEPLLQSDEARRLIGMSSEDDAPAKIMKSKKSLELPSMSSTALGGVRKKPDLPVWWFAPYFDQSSVGREAATTVLGMIRSGTVNVSNVWIGIPETSCAHEYDKSMPFDDYAELQAARERVDRSQHAIVVCNSLPPTWSRPKPSWHTCEPCPPVGYTPAVAVARVMAETDAYNEEFVNITNTMNEVWVPSEFSRDVLAASGVDADKIRVVPIGVNTTLFNPDTTEPAKLPVGELIFGEPSPEVVEERCAKLKDMPELPTTWYSRWFMPADPCAPAAKAGKGRSWILGQQGTSKKPFRFISTFKWDKHNGWDLLIQAYMKEFTSKDNVELYIITKEPMAGVDIKRDIYNFASEVLEVDSPQKQAKAPKIYVTSDSMEQEQYTGMYKAADCYVSASRGEGWSMPVTEAMSMGLPAIVTNWSGTADIVDDKVGYLINYTLSKVPNEESYWFRGTHWANANVPQLRKVMRHAMTHPREVAAKGAAARKLMIAKYSHEVAADAVVKQLARINSSIRSGKCEDCFNKQYTYRADGKKEEKKAESGKTHSASSK